MSTSCAGSRSGVRTISLPADVFTVPARLACTFISRAVVLRKVSIAMN